jgi:two-component system phosphate regulon sensor histidine kinase PhoR
LTSLPLLWRLFFGYFIVHTILVVGLLWLVGRTQKQQMVEQVEERLESITEDLQLHLSSHKEMGGMQIRELAARIGRLNEVRVTVIDPQGIVVADSWTSDLSSMNNHSNRPEVRAAVANGTGSSYRYSNTESRYMLYFCVGPKHLEVLTTPSSLPADLEVPAKPLEASTYLIRASVDDSTIQKVVNGLRQTVFLFTLAVGILGCFATYFLANWLIKPLDPLMDYVQQVAVGNMNASLNLNSSQREWDGLRSAFLHMQSEISSRETVLREYSQRLEAILGSMVEGVIAVNGQGEVLFANFAACDMLSLHRTGLSGRPLHEVIRYPELLNSFSRALTTKEIIKTEFETRGKIRRSLSIRITSLQDTPSAGTVIVARDVTEIRQLETMRSDFVANVSHELKTPLSSIKAYAETLRLGAMDDLNHRTRFIGEIEEQAERLYLLIIDLIQLARIESKQAIFETESIEVKNILLEAVESFAPVAKSKSIELELNAPTPLKMRGDAEGVRTIIDNLVSNAIRYTSDGGSVHIKGWQNEEQVGVEIRDTGIGIAQEHQVRIFERFYRVDKARSRDLGGTGLGLSIVKHLCQALGGTIDLESQVGIGSTFRVTFPRDAQPRSNEATAAHSDQDAI